MFLGNTEFNVTRDWETFFLKLGTLDAWDHNSRSIRVFSLRQKNLSFCFDYFKEHRY